MKSVCSLESVQLVPQIPYVWWLTSHVPVTCFCQNFREMARHQWTSLSPTMPRHSLWQQRMLMQKARVTMGAKSMEKSSMRLIELACPPSASVELSEMAMERDSVFWKFQCIEIDIMFDGNWVCHSLLVIAKPVPLEIEIYSWLSLTSAPFKGFLFVSFYS